METELPESRKAISFCFLSRTLVVRGFATGFAGLDGHGDPAEIALPS